MTLTLTNGADRCGADAWCGRNNDIWTGIHRAFGTDHLRLRPDEQFFTIFENLNWTDRLEEAQADRRFRRLTGCYVGEQAQSLKEWPFSYVPRFYSDLVL